MEEGGRTAAARPRIAPAAAAAVQSWVDVPDNILVSVSAFLSCCADYVHMASVNRHWNVAVGGLGRPPPPFLPPLPELPPQLPWIIFPSTVPPTFYSVLGDSYHRLYGLPADVHAALFRGSGDDGWLVLALDAPHAYALYNLNSGRRIPLPPGFRSPSDNAEFPLVVHTASLSASPSDGPYVVAAIGLADNRPTAAFWSPGRESWFSTGEPLTVMPQDVIYTEDAFFFVTADEELIVFTAAHGPNGDVTLGRVPCDMEQRESYDVDVETMFEVGLMKRYLVESRGELLLVVRYVFNAGLGSDYFRLLVLCSSATDTDGHGPHWIWDWEPYDDLDGRMLFLGLGCSRCFEIADYDGFKENMTYFLEEGFAAEPAVIDDSAAPDGPAADDMGSVHDDDPDMGRYSLAKMEAKCWPLGPQPRSDVPPTWWLH